jgi:uncharacterized Zn finger protein
MPRNHEESPELTGWARQWLDALKRFAPENEQRLARGATEARGGAVLEVMASPGRVEAAVMRATAFDPALVSLQIATLSDADWRRVATALAARPDLAARLLAGEVPLELEDVVASLGLSLVPRDARDISAACTCPEGHELCSHVAAVHYVLAANLEQQPSLLFTLHGRDLGILLEDVRQEWEGGQSQVERALELGAPPADDFPPPEPLRAEHFYRAGPALDALRITIAPPLVEAALLKRLGSPPFAAPEEDPIPRLTSVYTLVTRRALGSAGRSDKRAPGRE